MTKEILYVIQIKRGMKWSPTLWTRQGKPVAKRSALAGLKRVQRWFPEAEYRISAWKDKAVKVAKNTTKIARKHIMAMIEAAPYEMEYPRYIITSSLIRPSKNGGYMGVRVTWKIK